MTLLDTTSCHTSPLALVSYADAVPMTPHGRRTAEQAVHEANMRRVLRLVGSYGLSAGDRISLAQDLHRRAVQTCDRRVVADVWEERLKSRHAPEFE
jgi:hypothetical protein